MLGNDLFFVTLQAGVRVVRYDGCVECNKHVWHQDDKAETCPICAKPTRYAKPFVSLKYRIKNTSLHCITPIIALHVETAARIYFSFSSQATT